jgi:hypothetical protein
MSQVTRIPNVTCDDGLLLVGLGERLHQDGQVDNLNAPSTRTLNMAGHLLQSVKRGMIS